MFFILMCNFIFPSWKQHKLVLSHAQVFMYFPPPKWASEIQSKRGSNVLLKLLCAISVCFLFLHFSSDNTFFSCFKLDCYESALISNTYPIPFYFLLLSNVTSVKICQLQCQLGPACLSFTYSSQGMCTLSGKTYSNSLRRLDSKLGGISGPKFCSGML